MPFRSDGYIPPCIPTRATRPSRSPRSSLRARTLEAVSCADVLDSSDARNARRRTSVLSYLAWKMPQRIARADQNGFKSHQPIRLSQSASLPKATTANTMTPNDIGGSPAVSTAAATTSIASVAACISVIAEAHSALHFVAPVRPQVRLRKDVPVNAGAKS